MTQIGYHEDAYRSTPLPEKVAWFQNAPGMAVVESTSAGLGNTGNIYLDSDDHVTAVLRDVGVGWTGRAATAAGATLRRAADWSQGTGASSAGGGSTVEGYGRSFEAVRGRVHWEDPGAWGWDDTASAFASVVSLNPGMFVNQLVVDHFRTAQDNRNFENDAVTALQQHESATRAAVDSFPVVTPANAAPASGPAGSATAFGGAGGHVSGGSAVPHVGGGVGSPGGTGPSGGTGDAAVAPAFGPGGTGAVPIGAGTIPGGAGAASSGEGHVPVGVGMGSGGGRTVPAGTRPNAPSSSGRSTPGTDPSGVGSGVAGGGSRPAGGPLSGVGPVGAPFSSGSGGTGSSTVRVGGGDATPPSGAGGVIRSGRGASTPSWRDLVTESTAGRSAASSSPRPGASTSEEFARRLPASGPGGGAGPATAAGPSGTGSGRAGAAGGSGSPMMGGMGAGAGAEGRERHRKYWIPSSDAFDVPLPPHLDGPIEGRDE